MRTGTGTGTRRTGRARLAVGIASLALLVPVDGARADAVEAAASAEAAAPPALVVLLTVDQLRRDRLDPALPGGLGRLAREGLSFERASLAHAGSETCPGHVAIATGRHPGPAGAPANAFVDAATGELRYCVQDDPETAGVLGAATPVGRSPRAFRVDALGDWLDRANGESRVFAVAGKDRSAIALGGQHPDGAYWLGDAAPLGFTTSRYYAAELPGWVAEWNAHAPALSAIPAQWEHAVTPAQLGSARIDDYAFETAEHGRASPHALRGRDGAPALADVYVSPWVDTLTLDFAFALLARHGLGDDAVPDLLAISLSGTDTVGHNWGPESHEAYDALRRLDADVGEFLRAVEARVGRGRLVVALTSDHGVLPLPEWLAETGRATCPAPDARIALDPMRRRLDRHLHFALSSGLGVLWPRAWVHHAGLQITVDRARAAAAGRSVDEVAAVAKEWLERQPGVVRAWTAAELDASADEMAAAYRRSRDPERSGDLAVEPAEGCLFTTYATGTTHGSPWPYDRDVPLVLWGAGVEPGASDVEAATVDLAPTLAAMLGVAVPDDVDGHVLPGVRAAPVSAPADADGEADR